jgi:hypothetical protein
MAGEGRSIGGTPHKETIRVGGKTRPAPLPDSEAALTAVPRELLAKVPIPLHALKGLSKTPELRPLPMWENLADLDLDGNQTLGAYPGAHRSDSRRRFCDRPPLPILSP